MELSAIELSLIERLTYKRHVLPHTDAENVSFGVSMCLKKWSGERYTSASFQTRPRLPLH